MSNELREFVYLDEMSVNSLLASQYTAVPEVVKDATEDIEMEGSGWNFGGSLAVPGVGSVEGGSDTSSSDESRNLREVERKVNSQYRFSLLHDVLENSGKLQTLSHSTEDEETELDLDSGDPVKIKGSCNPDPFFNLLNSLTILLRIFEAAEAGEQVGEDWDLSEQEEDLMVMESESVFDIWKRVLHGERIGLKVESNNYNYPIVISIDLNSLWTDPKREFFSTKDYTVVGRVDRVISTSKWDYIDLLQIMGEVFSEDSVDEFRDVLMEVADDIEDTDDEGFDFDVDIDRSDYVVEGPAIVVDPIAIYW